MKYFVISTMLVTGCGSTVEAPPAPMPLERCLTETIGQPCQRSDGIGVCLSFDVCELPCNSAEDCPLKDCDIAKCEQVGEVEQTLCRYYPSCT